MMMELEKNHIQQNFIYPTLSSNQSTAGHISFPLVLDCRMKANHNKKQSLELALLSLLGVTGLRKHEFIRKGFITSMGLPETRHF